VIATVLAALLLTAPGPDALRRPQDGAYRHALDLLYDGRPEQALAGLARTRQGAPEDPIGPYLESLVAIWRLEQYPPSAAADRDLFRRIDEATRLADRALAKDPHDLRALLARGASQGVLSRFHLARQHRSEAAGAAVRMRENLTKLHESDPACLDALFGLGLYDYYADVLPRLAKVLRFLARMPGGDRERGLARIQSAGEGSLFHDDEVQAQLYEIYAFYEKDADRALAEVRGMRRRHPGWPLWALKLAEHLRDRMGLYAESAAVAREALEAGQRGQASYQGAAGVLARISLGESLLMDLRSADARRELLLVKDGPPELAGTLLRARLLLGRALEREGDREGAMAHYRRAATAADRDVRRQAEAALRTPIGPAELEGLALVAQARRLREAGRRRDGAEAYRRAARVWPASQEARLLAAEDDLLHGDPENARDTVDDVRNEDQPQPPWLRSWSRLLHAHLLDLDGERERAVVEYKKVLKATYGLAELRERAEDGLRRPYQRRAAINNIK
jgi:tetratricopeptide (TPR) repeat protein